MNFLFSALGLLMIASSENDVQRTIGAIVAGAGLNDILREHKES